MAFFIYNIMKYLKKFEGYIFDMNAEILSIKDKYMREIMECIEILVEDYELEPAPHDTLEGDYYTFNNNKLKIDISDSDSVISVIKDVNDTYKRLNSIGLGMIINFGLIDDAKVLTVSSLKMLRYCNLTKQNINSILVDYKDHYINVIRIKIYDQKNGNF